MSRLPAIQRYCRLPAILGALLALGGCTGSYEKFVGKPAPYTRLTLMSGRQIALRNLEGRKAVLTFWSVRCGACGSVLRDLDEMAAEAKKRGGPVYLAINIDEAELLPKVMERIEEDELLSMVHAFSGNGYFDEAYVSFGIDSLPTIFVIGENGTVIQAGQSAGAIESAVEG